MTMMDETRYKLVTNYRVDDQQMIKEKADAVGMDYIISDKAYDIFGNLIPGEHALYTDAHTHPAIVDTFFDIIMDNNLYENSEGNIGTIYPGKHKYMLLTSFPREELIHIWTCARKAGLSFLISGKAHNRDGSSRDKNLAIYCFEGTDNANIDRFHQIDSDLRQAYKEKLSAQGYDVSQLKSCYLGCKKLMEK